MAVEKSPIGRRNYRFQGVRDVTVDVINRLLCSRTSALKFII